MNKIVLQDFLSMNLNKLKYKIKFILTYFGFTELNFLETMDILH